MNPNSYNISSCTLVKDILVEITRFKQGKASNISKIQEKISSLLKESPDLISPLIQKKIDAELMRLKTSSTMPNEQSCNEIAALIASTAQKLGILRDLKASEEVKLKSAVAEVRKNPGDTLNIIHSNSIIIKCSSDPTIIACNYSQARTAIIKDPVNVAKYIKDYNIDILTAYYTGGSNALKVLAQIFSQRGQDYEWTNEADQELNITTTYNPYLAVDQLGSLALFFQKFNSFILVNKTVQKLASQILSNSIESEQARTQISKAIFEAAQLGPAHIPDFLKLMEKLNLETAVQGDKLMQDFESELFVKVGDHSQMVKAPTITCDCEDCVTLSPSATVSRLNISDQKQIFDLLKIYFDSPSQPSHISRLPKLFVQVDGIDYDDDDDINMYELIAKLTDDALRFELAKIAFESSIKKGLMHYAQVNCMVHMFGKFDSIVKAFQFLSEDQRLQLAEMMEKQDPRRLAGCLEMFNFTDKNRLFNTVLRLFKNYFGETGLEHPEEYPITEELAIKICLELVEKNFERYGLQKEEHRIKVAQALAADPHHVLKLLYDIQYFEISNYDLKLQIIKTAVSKEFYQAILPSDTIRAFNPSNFNLKENDFIDVLKIAAVNNPSVVRRIFSSDTQKEWGLSSPFLEHNEVAKFEIAKITAMSAPEGLNYVIKNFNFKNEEYRIILAKIVAHANALLFIEHLKDWDIHDANLVMSILAKAISENETPAEELLKSNLPYLEKPSKTNLAPVFEDLDKEILNQRDDAIRNGNISWLNWYKLICDHKGLTKEEIVARMPAAFHILKFENPNLRYPLALTLVNITLPKDLNKIPPRSLLFHLLINQAKQNFGLTEDETNQILDTLTTSNISRDSTEKEIFIRCFYNLMECPDFSEKEKGALLKRFFATSSRVGTETEIKTKIDAADNVIPAQHQEKIAKESIEKAEKDNLKDSDSEKGLQGFQLLDAIILAGKASMLKTKPAEVRKEADAKMAETMPPIEVLKDRLHLSETLKQVFIDTLGLKKVEEFDKKYLLTIGQSRNTNALLIYAGKAQSFDYKDDAIKILSDFATAILQGGTSYRKWRYKITPKSHLEMIFTSLNNEGKRVVNEALLKKWQEGKKIKFEINPEETSKTKLAAETQVSSSQIVNKKHLQLIVEDTDNWEDLLLCGTEVAGNCQNINGHISLNKCLLGNLADGKIRIIVVKDDKNSIVGRCIMRLLWDDVLKRPVIFQDRYYERDGAPAGTEEAINAMFKQRAKDLGLPLVREMEASKANAFQAYPNDLESLSCPAPFEYIDAAGSVEEYNYTIPAEVLQRIRLL